MAWGWARSGQRRVMGRKRETEKLAWLLGDLARGCHGAAFGGVTYRCAPCV